VEGHGGRAVVRAQAATAFAILALSESNEPGLGNAARPHGWGWYQ
jgi:hypothetical protein